MNEQELFEYIKLSSIPLKKFNNNREPIDGLRYIGVSDDFYIFKLPLAHPGHEHFRGCSGAPIIDTHGKTVALVSNCPAKTNLILGISLKRYKVAIDITYGDLEKNR